MIEIKVTETDLPDIKYKVDTIEDAIAIQAAFVAQDMHPNSWHILVNSALRDRVQASNQPTVTAWCDDGRVRIEITMRVLMTND